MGFHNGIRYNDIMGYAIKLVNSMLKCSQSKHQIPNGFIATMEKKTIEHMANECWFPKIRGTPNGWLTKGKPFEMNDLGYPYCRRKHVETWRNIIPLRPVHPQHQARIRSIPSSSPPKNYNALGIRPVVCSRCCGFRCFHLPAVWLWRLKGNMQVAKHRHIIFPQVPRL